MLAGSMPNSSTASVGGHGDEVAGHGARRRSPSPSSSHWRAAAALVRVSRVVNVFEQTTNRVSAGSRSWVLSYRSTGSMFDTNRHRMSGAA